MIGKLHFSVPFRLISVPEGESGFISVGALA